MSVHDVFLRAFRRDLAGAAPHAPEHYVRLHRTDPSAFLRLEEQARASGRPEPFISLALARAMDAPLTPGQACELSARLRQCGRFGEAVEVLQGASGDLPLRRSWLLETAMAELSLGRLEEAARALEAARDGQASEDEEVARLLGLTRSLAERRTAALASGAWEETRQAFDLWLRLGADGPAFDAIARFVEAGGVIGPEERPSFLGALQAVLTLHRPTSPRTFFRSLDQVLRSSALRDVLADICASLDDDPSADIPGDLSFAGLRAAGALALAGTGRLEQAIGILGALTLANHGVERYRVFLDRMVGQRVLAEHPLRLGPTGPRKVFDVFPFNDELRLLKIKLQEMAGWVDHFVLVEARQTFTGQPKPLVFEQNRAEFAAFDAKIVHVVVDAFPPYVGHPWAREYYQRNMGVLGLSGHCQEDDLVIISDADEVIWRDVVLGFDGEYARLGMEKSRFFLNYREVLCGDELKVAASVWRARYLRTLGLSYARDTIRYLKSAPRLNHAGWHFTSISDARGVAAKLRNTAHQDYAATTVETLDEMLSEVRAGRYQAGWERCELDGRFPACIRDRRAEFADVLL